MVDWDKVAADRAKANTDNIVISYMDTIRIIDDLIVELEETRKQIYERAKEIDSRELKNPGAKEKDLKISYKWNTGGLNKAKALSHSLGVADEEYLTWRYFYPQNYGRKSASNNCKPKAKVRRK